MHPHAKHQKDDPDFGELGREMYICYEPRRERSNDDARKQITNQGRQTEPRRDQPTDKGKCKADCNGCNKGSLVSHCSES